MDKTLKIKILVFSILGILLLLMVLIAFSFVKTDDTRPVTSLRDIPQSDFTYDEMMKVDQTNKGKSGEDFLESYSIANHDGLIDDAGDADTEEITPEKPNLISGTVAPSAPVVPVREAKQQNPARQEVERTNDPEPVTYSEPEEQTTVTPAPKEEKKEPETESLQPQEPIKRRRTGDAFLSAKDRSGVKGNVIKAAVHDDQTITSGSTVKMRTLEAFDVDGVKIPANTFIYGIASLQESRANIAITNIRMGNNIYNVSKSVYDNDGLQGIFIPDNLPAEGAGELNAEIIDNAPVAAGAGVVGSVVNSAVQTTKNVIRSTNRNSKVTLKANYSIYLK